MSNVDPLGGGRVVSFAQERFWFLDQLRPDQAGFLLPMALRIRGDLDPAALAGSLAAVVERHEVLRSRYAVVDGEVVAHPVPGAVPELERHDLGALPADERERAGGEMVVAGLRRPFDLAAAPQLRATLIRLSAGEHLLLIVVHHIAFDGLSWEILGAELAAGYAERTGGPAADPAPLPMSYADVAAWQRTRLTGERLAKQLDHWRGRLAGLAPLELPTDHPRPAVWDGAGDVVRFEVPAATMAEVDRIGRRHRVTRYMVVLAAFQALLGLCTGQSDLAVGTPVAARPRKEAERLIGVFVNTVPLRTDLSGAPSFAELLARVRSVALDAFTHAELPFELLAGDLAAGRDLVRDPLFQVSFSLRTSPAAAVTLPGLDVEQVRTTLVGTPFDLSLDTDVLPDGRLNARLQYATALFERSTVERLAEAFRLLLDGVLADPALPLVEFAPRLADLPVTGAPAPTVGDDDVPAAPPPAPLPLELPTDRRRPPLPDGGSDRVAVRLPAELVRAVGQFAEQVGVRPSVVLLAAYHALLARYGGRPDVAVATAGPDAAPLLLRGDVSGRPSFAALLDRVRAAEPEPVPPGSDRDGGAGGDPLLRVGFLTGAPDAPGIGSDLALVVPGTPESGAGCAFNYATALFDRSTVRRMAGHYRRLLAGALAAPDRPLDGVGMLDADERALLTGGGSDTALEAPRECLPELIAGQAARAPDATAVVFGEESLSYAELDARVDRLARHLRAVGVRAETPVAVVLRRDTDLVTALLAVHRAGGVYVPIDPAHPARRRDHVLDDSGAAVLIGQGWIRAELGYRPGLRLVLLDEDREAIAGAAACTLPATDPDGAAYIIYTSGSTGRPKGVVVAHAAIRNRVLWTVRTHGLGPDDRVLQKTTVGFDASLWEFLAPLVCGGTVVVAGDGVPRDPAAMVRAVAGHRVTVLQLVPSVLRSLVQEPGLPECAALRLVFSAGEPLPVELCERLLAAVPVRLVNTYGPTECAIDVTAREYTGEERGEVVAIGRPLDNTRILVLDADGGLCPVGVPGEGCVVGAGLARGYAGRGGLTAERFVPNPYPAAPGERMYRTGDLVRRRADGVLEYLGRLDRQVKVRGVRIEPSEIEAVLCEHPDVAAAAVGVYGDQQLVAHVVAAGGTPDTVGLRRHLAERLPESLVPALLRAVPALPLTASGKVDRDALPGLAGREDGRGSAPRTPVEATIAAVFADLLDREGIGVDDDFFELGGHSLLVTRLVFRMKAAFGVVVPVGEVFARRTVAGLAELLARPRTAADDPRRRGGAGAQDRTAGAVVGAAPAVVPRPAGAGQLRVPRAGGAAPARRAGRPGAVPGGGRPGGPARGAAHPLPGARGLTGAGGGPAGTAGPASGGPVGPAAGPGRDAGRGTGPGRGGPPVRPGPGDPGARRAGAGRAGRAPAVPDVPPHRGGRVVDRPDHP